MEVKSKVNFRGVSKIVIAIFGLGLLLLYLVTNDYHSGNNGMSINVALYLYVLISFVGGIFLFVQAIAYVTKAKYLFILYNLLIVSLYFAASALMIYVWNEFVV